MIDEEKNPQESNPLDAFEQVAAVPEQPTKKRLSANTRTLIAAVAIVATLAILLAVLLPLLNSGNGDSNISGDASANEDVYTLFDRSKDNTKEKIVQTIAVQNTDDSYTVRYNKTAGEYLLDGYEDLSLGETVDTLVDNLTVLNGYDRVETVDKLNDFGLEKPQAVLTVTYHDGSQNTLHIGNETPDTTGYYARLENSDTVYMLDANTVYYYLLKKGQYVETSLLASPTVKSDDADGAVVLKELTVTGQDGKLLALRQADNSDGAEYTYAAFLITKPYMRMVEETVAEALEGFTYLVASEATVLHPTAADKTTYGFDKPYATVGVTLAVQSVVPKDTSTTDTTDEDEPDEIYYYNESSATFTVGRKDEDGNYYIMLDGHDAIYLVSAGMLYTVVERTYDNTVSRLLFLKDITQVGKIHITSDDEDTTLLLKHDEENEDTDKSLTVTHNGKRLDTQNFRELYALLMGMSRYEPASTVPDTPMQHHIELFLNDGTRFLSLEFFPQTANLYTVRTTEGELFSVRASEINLFLKQVDNYLAGKDVADI